MSNLREIVLYVFVFVFSISETTYCATVELDVSINPDGSIPVTVTGTATCKGSSNYLVDVYLVINDRADLCIKEDHGSASCTAVLNRGSLPGTNVFKGIASDCGGSDTESYTLTLDNTPSVQIVYPNAGSIITGPFDIVANATFTPTVQSRKGVLSCGINPTGLIWNFGKGCDSVFCSLSYSEISSQLLSLPPGVYTVSCWAQSSFSVLTTNNFTIAPEIVPPAGDKGAAVNTGCTGDI